MNTVFVPQHNIMAYLMQNANASALYLSTTTATTVQTATWYSDSTAIYSLKWGGALSCPASVGGTCAISVTFNGTVISLPASMQTLTGTFIDFGNGFTSNCANQASSGLNTLAVTAQLSAVTSGQAAKIRETYFEIEQTG